MQFKPFFQSKTIVGLILAALGFLANQFHVNIADLLPVLGPDLTQWLNDLQSVAADCLTLAGLFAAAMGRIQAQGPLTLSKAKAVQLNSLQAPTVPSGASASTLSERKLQASSNPPIPPSL